MMVVMMVMVMMVVVVINTLILIVLDMPWENILQNLGFPALFCSEFIDILSSYKLLHR